MNMTMLSTERSAADVNQYASMASPYPPTAQLSLGSLTIAGRAIAAPMAGLSLPPFRALIMELGCALAYSEMVSCEGIHYSNHKTRPYYENRGGARPFGVQLFTARPEFLAAAIARIDSDTVDCYDINMGCPVRKVVAKGAGAALMKTPAVAAKLVAEARAATAKPVTVKIRAGWDDATVNCVEIARIAEAEGADAVIVHPRTRAQEFRGKARWELIGEVKRALAIPVIGNGDIQTAADATRMMHETGCDGVMIGRAAYRNPWIFAELATSGDTHLNSHAELRCVSPESKRAMVLRYIDLLRKTHEERSVICAMRAFLSRFMKGYDSVSAFHRRMHAADTIAALTTIIEEFAFQDHRA